MHEWRGLEVKMVAISRQLTKVQVWGLYIQRQAKNVGYHHRATSRNHPMFLIRLLLRLVLLLFLWGSLTLAWKETDWRTRLAMMFLSALLILGIYALRYLHSVEGSHDANGSLPSSAWQLMWSRQTPFFLPPTNQGASYEISPRTTGFNRMSPGFHVVSARLLPTAASALALWLISAGASRHLEWLNPWLLQVSGLRQADLSILFIVLGMACFMALYSFLQTQFMARIPARCMSQGCEGHAFLATEVDASNNWGRRRYQFVYICREHGHRHPTGVQCMGFLMLNGLARTR